MSLSETACYTLINAPDTEPYNEMQIKLDLGKSSNSQTFSNAITTKYSQKRAKSASRSTH